MAVYNQVLTYTFRDSLASGNPQKIIYGAYLDGEFGAIHTASLDAVSLSLNNTISGNNSFTGTNTFSGSSITTTFQGNVTIGVPASGTALAVNSITGTQGFTLSSSSGASNALAFGWNVGIIANAWNIFTQSTDPLTIGTAGSSGVFNLATSNAVRIAIASTGAVAINAPTSGNALTSTALANNFAGRFNGASTSGQSNGIQIVAGTTSGDFAVDIRNQPVTANLFQLYGDGHFNLGSSSLGSILLGSAAGNVTINSPSSGTALTVMGQNNANTLLVSAGANSGQSFGLATQGGTTSADYSFLAQLHNGSNAFLVRGDGAILAGSGGTSFQIGSAGNVTIGAPSSGNTLSTTGASGALAASFQSNTTTGSAFGVSINGGTNSSDYGLTITNATATTTYFRVRGDGVILGTDLAPGIFNQFELGYKDIPRNAQTTNYTLALSDRGKFIYAGSGLSSVTIPANGSVAFSIGSTVVVVNNTGGSITIPITTDTLNWFQGGSNSTGTRTIAASSVVTLLKVDTTVWVITGNGIS
jgi:hypothetical protein